MADSTKASAPPEASSLQLSFRVFAASLGRPMGEALRAHMGILHRDIDKLYPHERLKKALADLEGHKE